MPEFHFDRHVLHSNLSTQKLAPFYEKHTRTSFTRSKKRPTMSSPTNRAARLKKAGSPLEVGEALLPKAGENEIVVRNAAVAIKSLDIHMQDVGVFVQQWPTALGCDVAGEVHEVGTGVQRFRKGNRVIR